MHSHQEKLYKHFQNLDVAELLHRHKEQFSYFSAFGMQFSATQV